MKLGLSAVSARYWVPLALLIFVILSNRLLVEDPDMSIYGFDSISYLEIARASPEMPKMVMPHQHAQRFIGPWLVGIIGFVSPLSLLWTFEVITFLLLFLFIQINWRTCERLGCSKTVCLLVAAILTFNPYAVRFYLSIPTYIGDELFLIGLSLLLRALLFADPKLVVFSLFLAAVGRQTALLVLPTTCIWIFFDEKWRRLPLSSRALVGGLSSLLVIGTYIVTDKVADTINPVSINSRHVLGLLEWLQLVMNGGPLELSQQSIPLVPQVISPNQNALTAFAAYILRAFLSLTIPVAFLLGLTSFRDLFRKRSFAFNLLIATSLMICSQPMLAGPSLTGHPVIRLTMFCIPALVLAFAILTAEISPKIEWPMKFLAPIIALLALSSFHHRYTYLNGSVDHSPIFALFYMACGIAIFLIVTSTRLISARNARS